MNKVKVVTAFVDLPILHSTKAKYHELANRLINAVGGDNILIFDDYPFEKCWLADMITLPPADVVPADRYASPRANVMSNIVQHQRTTWAMRAAEEDPTVDVWVWLDFGVLKQGDWTGRPVKEEHIKAFLDRIRNADLSDNIPFPAIWGKGPIADHGQNWRFVGSTHIWPTKYLADIDAAYKIEAEHFLLRVQAMPNDLPIWAAVEQNHPNLPFKSYSANHDNTQFVNFRGIPPQNPLDAIALKHMTDKGEHHGYTTHYWDYFRDKRSSVRRLLEVGIGYKAAHWNAYWPFGASLRMWSDFFPDASIYGWDIAPDVLINEGRIHSDLVDQSSATSLMDGIKRLGGTFDVICDDGSHVLEHQILTAHVLMPFVKEGGVYIIEDVNKSPKEVSDRLPAGWKVEAHRSRAEPDHAYVLLCTRDVGTTFSE